MKNLTIAFSLFFVLGISLPSFGQDYEAILKNKEFAKLGWHLDNEVSVQFNKNKRLVPKKKAIQLLRQNLSDFGPVKWETMHKGASNKQNSNYVILKFYNANDAVARLFLHLEGKGKTKKITAIRLRKLS